MARSLTAYPSNPQTLFKVKTRVQHPGPGGNCIGGAHFMVPQGVLDVSPWFGDHYRPKWSPKAKKDFPGCVFGFIASRHFVLHRSEIVEVK